MRVNSGVLSLLTVSNPSYLSPIAVLLAAHLGNIAEGKRVTAADRKQEDEDRVDGGGTRDGGGANKQVVQVLAEIEGASPVVR